jgi:hypothetical protein
MRKLRLYVILVLACGFFLSACDGESSNPSGPGSDKMQDATTILSAYYSGIVEINVPEISIDDKFILKNPSGTAKVTFESNPLSQIGTPSNVNYEFIDFSSHDITINGELTGTYTQVNTHGDFTYTLNGTITDHQGVSVKFQDFGGTYTSGVLMYSGSFMIDGVPYNVNPTTGYIYSP